MPLSPLPPDLPKRLSPTARDCNFKAPERTPKRCSIWAASVVEYRNEAWDKVAREVAVRLCHAGGGWDCAFAAKLLKLGVGGSKDPALEQQCRDAACRLGKTDECNADVAGALKEREVLRERLRRECGEGTGKSCFRYGQELWGEQNPAGLDYFEKACQLGSSGGCSRVGPARNAVRGLGPW